MADQFDAILDRINLLDQKINQIMKRLNISDPDHDHDHDHQNQSRSYDPDLPWNDVLNKFKVIAESCGIDVTDYNLESVNRSIRWIVNNPSRITNMNSYLKRTLKDCKSAAPKKAKPQTTETASQIEETPWTTEEIDLAKSLTDEMIHNHPKIEQIISKWQSTKIILSMSILRLSCARLMLRADE